MNVDKSWYIMSKVFFYRQSYHEEISVFEINIETFKNCNLQYFHQQILYQNLLLVNQTLKIFSVNVYGSIDQV